jgi:hypothetical protein
MRGKATILEHNYAVFLHKGIWRQVKTSSIEVSEEYS